MGFFSDLLINSEDAKKPKKSTPNNKYYYNPDINFKPIYISVLGVFGMAAMYLKSGRLLPTLTGFGVCTGFAYKTHEYVNWHRVRFGNYQRAKMMEKQVKADM